MRIIIEHGNCDIGHWDYFHVEIIDNNKPDGYKILASASGDWKFISKVVNDWLDMYKGDMKELT